MKYIYLLSLLLFSGFSAASEEERFHQLLDEIWQFGIDNNPIRATQMGLAGSDHKLADMSPKSLESQHQQYQKYLTQLLSINAKSLSRTDYITYTIQESQLRNVIDNYTFNAQTIPFTSESGFYASLGFLPSSHRFNSVEDYDNYLKRLSAIPNYFEQQIYWLNKGIESGMTQPREVLEVLPTLVGNFVKEDTTESVFFRPFQKTRIDVSASQWQALRNKAKEVIEIQVNPAYQNLKTYFEKTYIPKAKSSLGASSWNDGASYYQNRVEYYTTTKMTAEEIHELGLSEVKRIRAEMSAVMQSLNYEGSLAEFIEFLRTDPQFYATSEKEILYYAAYLSKRIDALLPKLFSYLPRTPYGVEPVPANIAPNYTTGRYISPSNDTEPGYYWVNTYALDKRPLYALPALTLHEAVPGHHMQISLARELSDLPNVRRYTYISAFGEGWGLYSEYLGKEVDFYETAYDEFGRLSYEMWRASRLVVDTGIHMKGWSRQQAVNFMLENTALSEHNVRTEVDRYITWPGQALSYKIGELTIRRLREKAESELGSRFDVRDFHKAVLEHGSVPLTVLEENIDAFIAEHKTKGE